MTGLIPTIQDALAGVLEQLPAPGEGVVVFGTPIPRQAWLSANGRYHWREKSKRTQWLRSLAWARANELGVPTGLVTPVRAVAWVTTPTARREDPNNTAPTTKALIDGLTDHGCWPDDDSEHLYGPDHRRGPVTKDARWVVLFLQQGATS